MVKCDVASDFPNTFQEEAISAAINGGCPESFSIGMLNQSNMPFKNRGFPIFETKRTLSQNIPVS